MFDPCKLRLLTQRAYKKRYSELKIKNHSDTYKTKDINKKICITITKKKKNKSKKQNNWKIIKLNTTNSIGTRKKQHKGTNKPQKKKKGQLKKKYWNRTENCGITKNIKKNTQFLIFFVSDHPLKQRQFENYPLLKNLMNHQYKSMHQ